MKSIMDKVVSDLMDQEARWLEAELRTLVGTGMDLAVYRSGFTFSEDGDKVNVTRKLTCFPVFPGHMPYVPSGDTCTIYQVSKYKGAVPS